MGRLPHFLRYGATLALTKRARVAPPESTHNTFFRVHTVLEIAVDNSLRTTLSDAFVGKILKLNWDQNLHFPPLSKTTSIQYFHPPGWLTRRKRGAWVYIKLMWLSKELLYFPFFSAFQKDKSKNKTKQKIACSKRSDSGERCEVKKPMKSRGGLGREVREPSLTSPPPSLLFFRAPFTSHRSPLSERLLNAWNRLSEKWQQ